MVSLTQNIDMPRVQWGRTLWLNLLRGFAAGIVWAIVLLVLGEDAPQGPHSTPWYLVPLVLPTGYLCMLPFFVVATKIVTAVLGDAANIGVACLSIVLGLLVIVGDPLLFLAHKLRPSLLPVEQFSFVNFALIIYVLRPDVVEADTEDDTALNMDG